MGFCTKGLHEILSCVEVGEVIFPYGLIVPARGWLYQIKTWISIAYGCEEPPSPVAS